MKKGFGILFFGFFVSASWADYTGIFTSTTLKGGDTRTHNAIANCNRWDCTFGYQNGGGVDFTYSTSGSTGSTLTLNAILPPNPPSTAEKTIKFYINNATINPNSNLILNNFNSILLERTMSINNASLTFNANTSSNSTIFQMNTGSRVALSNANLQIRATNFLNRGAILVDKSTLTINATNMHSRTEIQNNAGTITINGNFYNVGQGVANGSFYSSVSNLTNNDGTIIITGSVLNGGGLQTPCISGVCGGGNIIINGGSMRVGGQLISQQMDGQASTIQIYGGTLIVNGGLQNKEGSTLTFGLRNGVMGKLQGSLLNDKGIVAVNVYGMSTGQNYQIINGAAPGLNGVSLVGANSQYFTSTYSNGSVSIMQTSSAEPENANEKSIHDLILAKFGGYSHIKTNIQTTIADTDKTIKDSVIAIPKSMINAFKGDTLLAPFEKNFETKRLAASDLIRFDNGRRIEALQAKPSKDFIFSPLGAMLKASDTNGYIAGFTLGANYNEPNFTKHFYLSYAYGNARQDLSTQSADTKAHLFQIGTMSRYKMDILEMDFNANFLLGDFTINNGWQEKLLSSVSQFKNYQLSFGLTAGARFGEKLSFKPFVGIQNYLELQDGFTSVLGFESKSYNAYVLDAMLGVEGHYLFDEFKSVYGKLGFESRLYNSHKHLFLRVDGNELEYENKGYDNAFGLSVGTQFLTWRQMKLNAEGLFKHYNTGLNYYGGKFVFKWTF